MKALTLVVASALMAVAGVTTQASAASCPTGFTCTFHPDDPGVIVSQIRTPTTHKVYNEDTGTSRDVPNSPPGGPSPHD